MHKIIVVDINGTPHEIENDTQPEFDVLARWSGNRYLVLVSNEGDLFSPVDPQAQIDKRDKERGGMFYRLKTCSQACYSQYTMFLRSKNRTHYLLAQRRFLNDF
jgi:hypothetical protein